MGTDFGRKGQQEVISIMLISGILIGVVGSVYFWGVPLIQKNKDIATLESAEDFMKDLNNRIKFVANNGGRDNVVLKLPAVLKFDPNLALIELVVDTDGTIYATDAEIPLGNNPSCSATTGEFGVSDPEKLCVKSVKIGDKNFRTTYSLSYLRLVNSNSLRDFQINLTGTIGVGSEQSYMTVEKIANDEINDNGRKLISSRIEVKIQ